MQITYATEAAPGHLNEDCVVAGADWALVLDGATAPAGVDSGCIHDVRWLVSRLAGALVPRLLGGQDRLSGILAAAIEETCGAHAATCDLGNPDSPSSTVSVVRMCNGGLEHLVLGDSPAVFRGTSGAMTVVSDERSACLPGGRPYPLDLVRSLRNQPGGFWVASTKPEAAYEAVTGNIPCSAVTAAGVFTDGASRLAELYGHTWAEVFAVLETGGPEMLISVIRSVERWIPLPDSKRHDDATAVLLRGFPVPPDTAGRTSRPRNWRSLVGM